MIEPIKRPDAHPRGEITDSVYDYLVGHEGRETTVEDHKGECKSYLSLEMAFLVEYVYNYNTTKFYNPKVRKLVVKPKCNLLDQQIIFVMFCMRNITHYTYIVHVRHGKCPKCVYKLIPL